MIDNRPSTSADPRGRGSSRRAQSPKMYDSLQRSQLNLAAALLDTASKGTQLTEGQKAEVCPVATEAVSYPVLFNLDASHAALVPRP